MTRGTGTFCYSCMREFKKMKNTLTCPVCHKAFCSKCLKYTHPVNNVAICQFCYKHQSGMKKQDDEVMKNFHDRYYKPLQRAQTVDHYRPKADVVASDSNKSKYGFTDDLDLELERRFRELRGPAIAPPSEQELKDRFDKMQDFTPQEGGGQETQPVSLPKTQAGQTDDLLKQAREEGKLGQRSSEQNQECSSNLDELGGREPSATATNPHAVDQKEVDSLVSEASRLIEREADALKRDQDFMSEAESRLGGLGRDQADKKEGSGEKGFQFQWVDKDNEFQIEGDDSEDGEVHIQRLIEQMVQESKLEDKLASAHIDPSKLGKKEAETGGGGPIVAKVHPQSKSRSQPSHQQQPPVAAVAAKISYPSEDDLPWCCICNDDAAIVCHDCEGDLYCMRCFKHGHEQFCMFGHCYDLYEGPQHQQYD